MSTRRSEAELGWCADFIGSDQPVGTLCRAVEDLAPKLFFISATHLGVSEAQFLADFEALSDACRARGVAPVVGGQALRKSLRVQMKYAACCETLEQLATFVEALGR